MKFDNIQSVDQLTLSAPSYPKLVLLQSQAILAV